MEPIVAPLTSMQLGMLSEQLMAPGIPVLNLGLSEKISGEVDSATLLAAIRETVADCDTLRAFVRRSPTGYVQCVAPEAMPEFEEQAFATGEEALEWGRAMIARPFDLFVRAPVRFGLARVDSRTSWIFIGAHHVFSDGWTLMVTLMRVAEAYAMLRTSGRVQRNCPQFIPYATDRAAYVGSRAHAADLDYWTSIPVDTGPRAADSPRPLPNARVGERAHRVGFTVPRHCLNQLMQKAGGGGASEFHVLLAGIYRFFSGWFEEKELTVGVSLHDRTTAERKSTVGPMLCLVEVLLSGGDCNSALRDTVSMVRSQLLRAYRHRRVSPMEVAEHRRAAGKPAFPRCFLSVSYLTYLQHEQNQKELGLHYPPTREWGGYESTPLHVSIGDAVEAADVPLELSCNGAWCDESQVRTMARELPAFLEHLASLESAEQPAIGDAGAPDLAASPERRTATGFRSLLQRFEDHAVSSPNAPALICAGESVTYAGLAARVDAIGRHLSRNGVGRDEAIAVCLPRHFDLIATTLAIWKRGAVLLPVDPELPQDRITVMLSQAAVGRVITQQAFASRFPSLQAGLIAVDALPPDSPALPAADRAESGSADDRSYIIFTSGSTGTPKGVEVEHGGLSNIVDVLGAEITSTDRVLQFSRVSFDAFFWELTALGLGASLCLPGDRVQEDGLAATLMADGVTVATLPPSVLAMLAPKQIPSLRLVMSAGEACSPHVANTWRRRCRFINAYGPTEVTICGSMHVCESDADPVPIGQAILNTQLHVLGEQLETMPEGAAGELYIGGAGVARGYLGRAGLTARQFIADPFGVPGSRMYRSGDRVRRRSDGSLEFLGRIDNQIKVRGHRIEPAEIEAALMSHHSVGHAAVVGRSLDPAHAPQLVAYVAPVAGRQTDQDELRLHLKQKLPDYMVPALYVLLDRLPLTPHGKVDRSALPAPQLRTNADSGHIAPHTPTERAIAKIWADVLKVPQIGLDDNFFELGGNSLSLMDMQTRLRDDMQRRLSMVDLMSCPTVRSLATHLN